MSSGKIMYYDVNLYNDSNEFAPARVLETRSAALLDNPSEYCMAFERFSIPGSLIPLFNIQPSGPNSYFAFSISYAGVIYPLSTDPNFPNGPNFTSTIPPFIVDGILSLKTNYNNISIWNYDQILTPLNNFIANIWNDIPQDGSNPQLSTYKPPYFTYNSLIQRFQFYVPALLFTSLGGGGHPPPMPLFWMSPSLANLLNYFPGGQIASFNPNAALGYSISVNSGLNFNYPTYIQYNADGAFESLYGIITQEADSRWAWSTLSKIAFVSNSFPTVKSFLSSTQQLTNNTFAIIKDFEPNHQGDYRDSNIFQYYPQGPLTMIEMNSSAPLNFVDIWVYWYDKFGNLFPIYLPPGEGLSFKILFAKKNQVSF